MANGHGGARIGAGRKVGSTKNDDEIRSVKVQIRLTKEEKQKIDEMVKASGLSLSKFILNKIFD